MVLQAILAHQSEAGHPELLDWIKHQLDAVVGLGPLAFVILLGVIILAIPAAVLLMYVVQRRDRGLGQP
jgi:hypothetical protein